MHRLLALAAAALACVFGAVAAAAPSSAPATALAAAPHAASSAGPTLGIRHVFVIVLENESYDASYTANPNPWLGRILQKQGTLLTQYYATGHVSLDNYVAMMSGQGPNAMTQSDCQDYVDFQPSPAVIGPDGQAVGQGCVYPPQVLTLADQLQAAHRSWRGYMEDMGNDETREPDRCGEPASSAGTGMHDGTQSAEQQDQYAARHNPFVYFHSLLDTGSCERNVVPLPHLAADLASARTTPNLVFITPNLCDDGHDAPCAGPDATGAPGSAGPGGLTSVDHFLSVWVPRIEASPAFKKDGLLVITTDEAATSDATSCCGEQPGPDSPMPGITGPGGGRTGTLVIGRCVRAGHQDATAYNHYSLLRTLEDLFGVHSGGSDGKGHLGYAGASGVTSFGADVFATCTGK